MAAAKKEKDETVPRRVVVIKKGYDNFAIRKEGTVLIWKKAGPLPSWLALVEEEEPQARRGGKASAPAADTLEDDLEENDKPEVVI